MPLQVGQRIGDYEVQQMLGVGGMGHVYRVRNIISNRTEAMKVLLPDLTAEPDLATRFISEIRTLASFDHPNIAQLHTALIAENQLIMMMEYVEGYTLEQMAKQRTMPVAEVAGYISQSLSALGYAHARGVVHRDVKPANLMVTSHGIVKLMDFGIAKSNVENNNHTRPGTTLGSLYYMSPEQVRGDTVDARSDIYSVGIVLYELLAGRRPFEAETTFTILNKQLNEAPQPPMELNPDIPAGLNAIILIALAKDPGQRFQNADAFRNALKSFCAAPGEHEVATPVAAPVATPVAAAVAGTVAAPIAGGFAPVAMPSAGAASAPMSATSFAAPAVSSAPPQAAGFTSTPPAYAEMPQAAPAYPTPPAKASRSHKPLWIATGAIAVLLALAAVGLAPRWMKTRAAASAATTAASADLPALPPPPSDNAAANPPASDTAAAPAPAPVSAAQPAHSAVAPAPAPAPISRPTSSKPSPMIAQNTRSAQSPVPVVIAPQPQPAPAPASQPAPNREELDQARDRLSDMSVRGKVAHDQIAQMRREQQASGLDMRGDILSADARLESYLGAASSDLQRGNAAGATQDLNRAEPELKTLEKFLGH